MPQSCPLNRVVTTVTPVVKQLMASLMLMSVNLLG